MRDGEPEATGTPQPTGAGDAPPVALATPRADARFAHASEAEMARILDFYEVRWDYEPTTFPILWNTDGDVIESFAPDFYLPDVEMFLEMTTLKQRLVRKKNRKLRRLRELYPDIRIKLFYARDFRAMLLKYGRLGLLESLSGTVGQVVPERAAAVIAGPAPPPPSTEVVSSEPHEPIVVDASITASHSVPVAPGDAAARRGTRRRRRSRHTADTGAAREAEA